MKAGRAAGSDFNALSFFIVDMALYFQGNIVMARKTKDL